MKEGEITILSNYQFYYKPFGRPRAYDVEYGRKALIRRQ